MKKVLALCGSARHGGNTDLLLDEVLLSAREMGAETEKIYLSDLNIKPCTGCSFCKQHEACSQEDDYALLLDAIRQANAIVIGSPVYMGNVTGQTKLFLDRLYQLRRADRTIKFDGSHIRGAVVVACGSPSQEHPQATVNSLKFLFRFLNQPKVLEVVGTSLGHKGAAQERDGLLEEAREVGRRLVE